MFKTTRLVGLATVFVFIFLALTMLPQGEAALVPQNTNSSTTRPPGPPPSEKRGIPPPEQDFSKNTWDLPPDADKTKNPVESNEESIAKGKDLFMGRSKGNCIFCHGETGAGNKENLPRLRRVPADLSDAKRMPRLSDGEIFWKITRGIPGIMPSREKQLTEEERWQVVNFVRTLAQEKPSM